MKRIFFALVFTVLTLSSLRAQEPGIEFIENKPWQEILALSATSDKLIFLDCYTTWCGPCKAMAKDVFPLPEVGAFMNARFVNVKQDMEKGEGIDLNKKYKKYIPGYPTYLLINAKGEVVHQVSGYNAADKFIAKINDGLEQRSWIALTVKYEGGERSFEFLQTYLKVLEDAYQKDKIDQVTSEMLRRLTLPVITENEAAYKMFRKYWKDAEDPLLAAVLSSPGVYRKYKDPEKEINEWAGRLYKTAVDSYVKNSTAAPEIYDRTKAAKLIEELRRLGVSGRENMISLLLLSEAVMDKNGNRFIQLYNAATEFGLLSYEKRNVSTWVRRLAEQTSDKKLLAKYLACAAISDNDRLLSFDELRNYAFVLEKTGDKTSAQKYYKKADQEEAAFKERFKGMFDNK